VIAYGRTTKRLNTGNVSKVSGDDIARQPVSNALSGLAGRVPGLNITESSGLNGAGIKVQLRGTNSLLQGSEPFYIIDGVPFVPGNNVLNQTSNAASTAGLSPLNLINTADIESIEVLKDADATSIYGSRGANGVILITTRKGKAGKDRVSANFYTGWSKVTRTMDLLNTKEYVTMRKEGLQNDGLNATINNSPDLTVWDTTAYTDFKAMLIGGTARVNDMQVSLSGGKERTTYLLRSGFRRQNTVFPGNFADQKSSIHINVNHQSEKRFRINLTISYLYDKNEITSRDLTSRIFLPPNIKLRDSLGNLIWENEGIAFASTIGGGPNPLAYLFERFTGKYQNIMSNIQISYHILPGLQFRAQLGYNRVNGSEVKVSPSTSIDPNLGTQPSSIFNEHNQSGWIGEPQVEYNYQKGHARLNLLTGLTWQENINEGVFVSATNYTNDIFLNSISGAGNVLTTNSFNQYRYQAGFGRINYEWQQKYIVNFSVRRDGSSRFGKERQYSNFGSIGTGWIFTKSKLIQRKLKLISFGKLRASYGISGNDQIGDYKYLDTWAAATTTYQGTSVINPTALYNPELAWERNKKLEMGAELGFWNDRIMLSASLFRNISNNQLVAYTLPIQTGFNSVNRNLNASLENKGLELLLSTKIVSTGGWNWTSSFNISFIRNKLLDFPGLSTSSYSTTYIIGQPISSRRVYRYIGVNSSTGVYEIEDYDKDGRYSATDRISIVNTDPAFFGGLINSIGYKNLQLEIFFDFKKQTGRNYLANITSNVPGMPFRNQPHIVLERWQKQGDVTDIQRFTSTTSSLASIRASNIAGSDASYSDASFARLKTISLLYKFPQPVTKKIGAERCELFMRAQNIFTFTKYKGSDPENQSLVVLPPLKTVVIGFQIVF
jgi:TonB-linked SusC/RagA family outer membrane protein